MCVRDRLPLSCISAPPTGAAKQRLHIIAIYEVFSVLICSRRQRPASSFATPSPHDQIQLPEDKLVPVQEAVQQAFDQ
jgi:hypothetical protein